MDSQSPDILGEAQSLSKHSAGNRTHRSTTLNADLVGQEPGGHGEAKGADQT